MTRVLDSSCSWLGSSSGLTPKIHAGLYEEKLRAWSSLEITRTNELVNYSSTILSGHQCKPRAGVNSEDLKVCSSLPRMVSIDQRSGLIGSMKEPWNFQDHQALPGSCQARFDIKIMSEAGNNDGGGTEQSHDSGLSQYWKMIYVHLRTGLHQQGHRWVSLLGPHDRWLSIAYRLNYSSVSLSRIRLHMHIMEHQSVIKENPNLILTDYTPHMQTLSHCISTRSRS